MALQVIIEQLKTMSNDDAARFLAKEAFGDIVFWGTEPIEPQIPLVAIDMDSPEYFSLISTIRFGNAPRWRLMIGMCARYGVKSPEGVILFWSTGRYGYIAFVVPGHGTYRAIDKCDFDDFEFLPCQH